ncbi:MAG: hypothetical protein ABIT83_24680 [Massilia sp.]
MLQSFLRSFRRTILTLVVLVAVATVNMGNNARGDELAGKLRRHVEAIASHGHNTATTHDTAGAAGSAGAITRRGTSAAGR